MNIYEKMLAITSDLSAVAKNLTVGEGRSSYKAVGEADVLAAVKPLEAKYKIYSYPFMRQVIGENVMTTTSTYNGNTKEINKLFVRIETTYRFVNVEKPDEYIDIVTYGDGVDAQDKAPGKAMTYADKYALLKAYKIITGDDPDQKASEEGNFKSIENKKISELKVKSLTSRCQNEGVPADRILTLYKVAALEELTEIKYANIVSNWSKIKEMK